MAAAQAPSCTLVAWVLMGVAGNVLHSLYFFAVDGQHHIPSALFTGFVITLISLLAVYYLDIVGLVMMSVWSMLSISLHLIQAFPVLYGMVVLLFVLTVVGGIVLRRRTPELVGEEDYKPDFVIEREEAQRLSQELAAAKSLQQRLLPHHLPSVEKIEIRATCIPAYEVGGDYYDFFQLDHSRLGILIGDVSGKGISAAFYITLAKGVIVSQVRQAGSPSDVLHRVNSLLYDVMERGKFVSMLYGIYDSLTDEFLFASAGHNPLIVRRASGEMLLCSSKGMAVGLDKGERFELAVQTTRLVLAAGDVVLLYTDGVTEAMNVQREEYGEERLCRVVAQSGNATADSLVSSVLADVRSFVGNAQQHDDITIVALRVL